MEWPLAKVNVCWHLSGMGMKPKKQSKSDRTRDSILSAARHMFAEHGFERTTVRDIGARASIDPAMIIRYFGSKDQLFALVAEFDLKLPDLSHIDQSEIGEVVVRHFLRIWEGEIIDNGLPILLRSAASNEFAAQRLRDMFASQVMPALSKAGGRSNMAQRAGLVASQLLGLALCRYVLKLPPVVDTPGDVIVREIGRTIQNYYAAD